MADKNNQTGEQENLSQLLQIRRDKLKELQESGNDPFTITRYVVDNDSANIKDNFDALEGQEVSLAGRLMSKRGMGKVSFCDYRTSLAASSSTPGRTRWTRRSMPASKSTTSATLWA